MAGRNAGAAAWVEALWYRRNFLAYLLLPVSVLFAVAVKLRRCLYDAGLLEIRRMPVPVIVVGNISVGGTGKTPLVVWLAEFLREKGYRPGIVSRGYGGRAENWPQRVSGDSDAVQVGDEALLIARRTGCPMAVSPKRVEAAAALVETGACDILISDDGLQHYALGRDVEIVVIDGERRFGNGFCLPSGPLREPPSRLAQADLVVCNGAAGAGEFAMVLEGCQAVNLADGAVRALAQFVGVDVHAVAGIGHPQRFFRHLEMLGLHCHSHPFPDHYVYNSRDLQFDDPNPVLMTEKDAVKCRSFADERLWYVPVRARIEQGFAAKLLNLLQEIKNGQ